MTENTIILSSSEKRVMSYIDARVDDRVERQLNAHLMKASLKNSLDEFKTLK